MLRGLLAALALASMVDGKSLGVRFQAGDLYEADFVIQTAVYQDSRRAALRLPLPAGFRANWISVRQRKGDLFVSDYRTGNIYEFNATSGSRSTFASRLIKPQRLGILRW